MSSIVLVEWIDAFGCPPGWQFEDEAELRCTTVRSVGFLLKKNAKFLLLVPHLSSPSDNDRRQLAGHIAIPRRQVVSMTVISSSHGQAAA